MSLLAQIMEHEKQKDLIAMAADGEKLFQQCKAEQPEFSKFNEWIRRHIETSLATYAEYKRSRLAKIFKRGETKLQKQIEERKNKESVLL